MKAPRLELPSLPDLLTLPLTAIERAADLVDWTANQVLGETGSVAERVGEPEPQPEHPHARQAPTEFADLEELLEELVEDGVELVVDVLEETQDLVEDALGVHRRVWEGPDGHAQIEVRGLDEPKAVQFRRRVKEALEQVESVRWAEVNAITGRVAVAFDPSAQPVKRILNVVHGVEEAHGMLRRSPAERGWDVADRADHPADVEPIHRAIAMLAGNTIALGVAVGGRVMRAPRIPIEFAAATSLVEHIPFLRQNAEKLMGKRGVDLVLPLVTASANGIAQGPVGILVDIAYQASSLTELQARQRVWERREPDMYAEHQSEPIEPPLLDPRPMPIPPGPIEEWSERIAMGAFGGAALTLAISRNPRRAADTLLSSMPKAARFGREGFAAQLGRTLAARGVVPLDASALRRLDRVDTVVLDSATLLTGRVMVEKIFGIGDDRDLADLSAQAERLLEIDESVERLQREGWSLRPLAEYDDHAEISLTGTEEAEIREAGCTPMVLVIDQEPVALIGAIDQLDPGGHALVRSVRRAGLRLVVAGLNGRVHQRIGADTVISAGATMGSAIRDLQADGAVVAVVARRGTVGLSAADVGINLARPSGRPSWGGDLLCGPDLTEAAFIIDACEVAAAVSRRSAQIAGAGSSLGAIASVTGLRASAGARTMTMVNGAAAVALTSGTWAGIELARRPRVSVPDPTPWHQLGIDEVLHLLESSLQGLSTTQAAYRRRSVRHDESEAGLAEPFLAELANPLNPVLVVGAGLSAMADSAVDAGMVVGTIGINTLVGGLQRLRTDRALSQMLRSSANEARVVRDGNDVKVVEEKLVRGDIVNLEVGEVVPADLRILSATNLEVDESNLTGESLPVAKSPEACPGDDPVDRSCMLYEDSTISAGEATAVVVATGDQTQTSRNLAAAAELGQIHESGVEVRLRELTRQVVPFAGAAAAGVVGAGIFRRWPFRDILGTGVSLAVASVPEGLPFIATGAQLASARRLSARNAVVRNPRTIEALGRVNVLCFDKTGTLTAGQVRLQLVSDGTDQRSVDDLGDLGGDVLAAAYRATAMSEEATLNRIDRSILHTAETTTEVIRDRLAGWTAADELPFEAARGLHAVLGHYDGGHLISAKGAPEAILPQCGRIRRRGETVELDRAELERLGEAVESLASEGYRVLAVAERVVDSGTDLSEDEIHDLELFGFLAFSDPVRPTAADAVRGVREAGVETIMITGDHPVTAEAIARGLNMFDPVAVQGSDQTRQILTGRELDELDDESLAEVIEQVAVFARVTPDQKVRIVQALQRAGRVVAMTGDGANDAPAIRLADVGVALGGRGTSSARDAADMVVTDDRLETIIDALAEGRALWGSVREAIAILVGGNLGEVGFTFASSLFSRRAPMNPRQFLLVNLVTDLAPAMAVAVRPPADATPETLLREGPEASLGSALNRDLAVRAMTTAGGATAAWGVARLTGTPGRASTIGLVALVGTQLGQTAVAGRRSPLVLATAAGSAAVLFGVVQTPGLSQFFGCRPLGPFGWATATSAAATATAASVIGNRLVAVP